MHPWRVATRPLAKITESILDSYVTDGGINHLCGPNLPSRTTVADILRMFEDICFPGFHREEELHGDSLEYVTGHKVVRLFDHVTEQVFKNDSYDHRMSAPEQKLDEDTIWQAAREFSLQFLEAIPELRTWLLLDVNALLAGDPAARSREEVILAYPGLQAISVHRIAHFFWRHGKKLLARMMSEHVHATTGIDIHPGAEIGRSFYIDHGTGVVIGETTTIGDHVKIYQGVSLGALSVSRKLLEQKRHPTIEDHVTIYAGATILGGDTVVGHHSVVGGNVWLIKSVPAYSLVENDPRIRVLQKGQKSNQDDWFEPPEKS